MKRSSVTFIVLVALAGGWSIARITMPSVAAQAGGAQAGASATTPRSAAAPAPYSGSPYLGELRNKVLYGEIWERPQLSKRARSMITIAVLQAQSRDELRGHIERGLTNGLTAEEISEIILHTTFYAGWPTGATASRVAAEVFEQKHLTLAKAAEYRPAPKPEKRAYTSGAYGAVPRLGELRNSLLYGDVWERPQLSKHDRSLITCVVAQALGATNELRGHINRALDQNKVTPQELSEAILHTAFYAGWPASVNAGGLLADAFKERGVDLEKLQ